MDFKDSMTAVSSIILFVASWLNPYNSFPSSLDDEVFIELVQKGKVLPMTSSFDKIKFRDVNKKNLEDCFELKYMKILGRVMIVIGIFGAITLPMTALYSFQDLIYFLTYTKLVC